MSRPASGFRGPGWGDTRLPLVIAALSWLVLGGAFGLLEPTETRYAAIARSMSQGGDWLVPHLNGLPHFHKPPLAYWAAAAGMGAFGFDAFGARLGVALAALVALAAVARLAGRLGTASAPPARAAWILASLGLFATVGRTLGADPFLTAAVLVFWAFSPSPWALAAIGFGFLAKGPVVLLHTVVPVLVAAAWSRDRSMLARLGPAAGWWLAALIALPWYLVVVLRTPDLLGYLLGNQILERVTTAAHQRGGPAHYYLPVVAAGLVPWTGAFLTGCVRLWKQRHEPGARLLFAWALVPVFAFSAMGSKLPGYILPSMGAFALIAAHGAESRAGRVVAALCALAAAGWILIGGGPALAGLVGLRGPGDMPLPSLVLLAGLLLVVAAATSLRFRPEITAIAWIAALTCLGLGLTSFDGPLGSPRRVARLLIEQRRAGEPVVEVGRFNAGLPFHLGETILLLEVPVEVQPAVGAPRAPFTEDSLADLARRHGRVWTFGRESRVREISAANGLHYQRLASWRRDALGTLTAVPGR